MPALGLFQDQRPRHYFERFPQILDQTVEGSAIIDPLTLERLLQLIVAAPEAQGDFFIVTHGHPDGLYVPLTRGTERDAHVDVIRILLIAATTQREAGSAGTSIRAWRRILERLGTRLPDNLTELDAAAVRQLRQSVEEWLNGTAGDMDISRAALDRLVALIGRVHGRRVGTVDFRGCNLGRKEDVLAAFKRFFAARRMRAPRVRSFFGTFDFGTHLNARAVRAVDRKRGGRVYGAAPDRVAVAIRYVGHNAELDIAAESEGAAVAWLRARIGALDRYRRRVPLHWLQTTPPAFPRDDDYIANLRTLPEPEPEE